MFAKRRGKGAIVREPPAALQDFLGRGLILPEAGIRDARFKARQLVGQPSLVKAPSEDRRPARPAYRIP